MKDIDLGWAAGLYEGEGNVYVTKRGNITVTIAMTDKDVVDRIDLLFPGKRYVRDHDNHWKRCYVWVRNGKSAVDFLEEIESLLGSRRSSDAKRAIAYWNRPDTRKNKKKRLLEDFVKLSDQGLSAVEIARELNISTPYVYKIRRELAAR